MIQNKTYRWMLGLLAAGLLSACGGDNSVSTTPEQLPVKTSDDTKTEDTSQPEITIRVIDNAQETADTRTLDTYAVTYNNGDLETEGFFRMDIYYAGQASKYQ